MHRNGVRPIPGWSLQKCTSQGQQKVTGGQDHRQLTVELLMVTSQARYKPNEAKNLLLQQLLKVDQIQGELHPTLPLSKMSCIRAQKHTGEMVAASDAAALPSASLHSAGHPKTYFKNLKGCW